MWSPEKTLSPGIGDPQITVTVSGPQGCGKTLFINAVLASMESPPVSWWNTFRDVNGDAPVKFVEEQS